MRVTLFDHVAFYRRDQPAIEAAISRVLASGQIVMGPDVRAFEEEFAAYCGVAYAAAVHSGTSALVLALRALGIGPGDEVITVANSDVPTSHAITHTGARPVWVDIDPRTCTMDPAAIEAAVTPRTRAILPVHLYGIPADMDPIRAVAERRGLPVVEDACLAPGATYRGRRVGSLGVLGVFSTTPGKILGGAGSGGVITTNDRTLIDRLKSLRNYGKARSPYPDEWPPGPRLPSPTIMVGYNERLDTLQAAVLRISLARLEEDVRRRQEIAATYARTLRGRRIGLPQTPQAAEGAWHVYTIRVPRPVDIQQALHAQGYETARRYLPPNHLDPCYRSLGCAEGSLPETERAAREILCLPVHPFMDDADAEAVARAVIEAVEALGPVESSPADA